MINEKTKWTLLVGGVVYLGVNTQQSVTPGNERNPFQNEHDVVPAFSMGASGIVSPAAEIAFGPQAEASPKVTYPFLSILEPEEEQHA